MSNNDPHAITNTNSRRVSIVKNRDGSFLIFSAGHRLTADGLGEAMAAAYRLTQ